MVDINPEQNVHRWVMGQYVCDNLPFLKSAQGIL